MSTARTPISGILACLHEFFLPFSLTCDTLSIDKNNTLLLCRRGKWGMANQKTEKLAEFYRLCQEKGWTDMTDETHRLKAKVIASDLGLNYSKLDVLYEKARDCHETVETEREQQRREKERLEELQKINGELILVFSDAEQETSLSEKTVQVFRRSSGLLYYTSSGSKTKHEGAPPLVLRSGDANLLSYEPSKTVYTSVTVGGVTTGGVSETGPSMRVVGSKSDKGELAIGNSFTVKRVILPKTICYAFRRDSRYLRYANNGTISLFQDTAMANTYSYAVKGGLQSGDTIQVINALRLEAEERRLSLGTCKGIMSLLQDILDNRYPPTDQELFQQAQELSESDKSEELKKACSLLEKLMDSTEVPPEQMKPLLKQTQEKYEETLQKEKEAAILAKEAEKEKRKKYLTIAIPAVVICIAAVFLMIKVIIPNSNYKKAATLLEAGQCDEAIAAFEALGDYKDSVEQIELAKSEKVYQGARALFEEGQYDEAAAAFQSLGKYKDSADQIVKINETKKEEAYQAALTLFENGEYDKAAAAFRALGKYKDSAEQIELVWEAKFEPDYQEAIALFEAGQYKKAIEAFASLTDTTMGDYKDSAQKLSEVREEAYQAAQALIDAGQYKEAIAAFEDLGEYEDTAEKISILQRTVLLKDQKYKDLMKFGVGDIIVFGSYEQDNDQKNGAEPIEWIVIEKEGSNLVLLSKYVLDGKPYMNEQQITGWETSDLCAWLNQEFLSSAFSKNDRFFISADNQGFQVSVPSRNEMEKAFPDNRDRVAEPTAFALTISGIYISNYTGSCSYHLRQSNRTDWSPYYSGAGFYDGPNGDINGVRPMIRIDFSTIPEG